MKKKEPETPNLPFYFKRIAAFLENVKVSPAQKREVELAREALEKICLTIYGNAHPICPAGEIPLFSQYK